MIVTFCGHSDWYGSPEEREHLRSVIRDLIVEGADTFYLGGYGGFDSGAAGLVRELKEEFPHIRSVLVIPYLDREYNLNCYDESLYPPIEDVPLRFAISKRNEWMVEQADVVVSGVRHGWGGAATTLKYAQRKKKRIISITE